MTPRLRLLLPITLWGLHFWFLASVLCAATTVVAEDNGNDDDDRTNTNTDEASSDPPPVFQCPDSVDKAQNDFDGYWTTYHEMNQDNLDDPVNFRDRGYDYRQATYTEMKANAYAFKQDFFGTIVQPGNHIYESACGEGLNLLLTLEILHECCGISNVTVHGNDYLADSVQVAHQIYAQERARIAKEEEDGKVWFRQGMLCRGDSTNLRQFVPANAFDVAYTGFIDPLLDPLELMDVPDATLDDKVEMIEEICEAAALGVDPAIVQIADDMQRLQEDWHAAWVTELIRIVKPGKYVIIEDVGWPACSFITEWGGVDPEWWDVAVERYGWDVEVDSIQILDEAPYVWYNNRYNVRMKKKKTDHSVSPTTEEDEEGTTLQTE